MSSRATEPLDREEIAAQRALAEFRKRVADPYWIGRWAEVIAGLAEKQALLDDFADDATGEARNLGTSDERARMIGNEALEKALLRAQEYVEAMRKAVRFALPAARDAAARRVDLRFGSPLAPSVSAETLRLHFGEGAANERLGRWRVFLEALAPKKRRVA